MDALHRDILKDLKTKIVDDVDVENGIIGLLTRKDVLKREDVEPILQEPTKPRRAELLLDILPRCGRAAFDTFRRGLRHHYPWLDDEIDQRLNSREADATDFIRNDPECPNLRFQPPTVFREQKVRELRTALEKLKNGGYLALHGMKGFGKSSLTTSTLTDTALVSRLFNNQIYWIKFGYESLIEDEILIQLNNLYHQVFGSSNNANSSLSSETVKQHLLNSLRYHFNKYNNCGTLLILDDVWSKDIIKAFDFSCKTLVITIDLDILEEKQYEIVQIKDGFTEAETLDLFSKVLDIEVKKLLPEVKRIHEECYGMPMVISMLAAEFKKFDDMDSNQERWLFYLNSLRTKDTSNRVIEKMLAKLEAIFEMCIDTLEPAAKSRYNSLVIFSEDVNITSKTLKILWEEKELCQVDVNMLSFCEKSLAARHRNVYLNNYVYGVHDLLLCYLRKKMTAEELRGLHRSLVEKYRQHCNGDFSKLPDDNYSFSYIGHHLEQAGMYDEFSKLYFDFDFLTEKIYHSGLSDLLIDLNKYRRFIIGDDEENRAKVEDLEKFLKIQAGTIVDQKHRKCLDLIQIGLNHSSSGFVRQKVCEIAGKQSSKLYVTYDNRYKSYEVPASLEVVTDMTVAIFANNPNKILIGNSSGEVILWNCETRERSVFSDNLQNSTIRKIIVSSNGEFFLTLCDSGQVNLFNIMREDQKSSDSFRCIDTPKEKQDSWHGIYGEKVCKNSSRKTIFIKDETIADIALSDNNNGDKRIGICTSDGTIEVQSIDGKVIFSKKVAKLEDKQIFENFELVTFTKKRAMLQVMTCEGIIRFYSEQKEKLTLSERYRRVFLYDPKFEDRNFVLFQPLPETDNCLVIVTESRPYYLTWYEVYDKNDSRQVQGIFSPEVRKGSQVDSVKSLFTCAALTGDGQYLITGHSRGLVTIWRVDDSSDPIANFSGQVNSLNTYWLQEKCHLISGSGDRVIHRWPLCLENLLGRATLFDAVMKPWGEDDIVAKEFENNIDIYRGDSMLIKIEPNVGTITDLSINPDGNKVVYASRVVEITKTGQRSWWMITIFDTETKESTPIFKLECRPNILKFIIVDGISGVVCGENSNLKVWYNNITCFINTGNVVSMHILDTCSVITVTRNGTAKLWRVHKMAWWQINSVQIPYTENDTISHSCLSPNKMSLAIFTANGIMIIYEITRNNDLVPAQLEISDPFVHIFDQKTTCSEYSQDNHYLAIGLNDGSITIFAVLELRVLHRLDLHCNEVQHLQWSPDSIGSPILLSANRDELAWWNLSSVLTKRFESSKNWASENGNSSNADDFWKTKTLTYSNRNTLLSVVPLPPTSELKLYISSDFSKLLFVDIHGSVCNLKFFNYTNYRIRSLESS